MVEIKANEIKQFPLSELIPWEKNTHIHTKEQIDKLCELIKFHGWRDPIIADIKKNADGNHDIVAGCGRYGAAQKLKLKTVPVVFQEFKTEEEKFTFSVSHNAIGKDQWAKLDLGQINFDIGELGPFDVEMLGIKDFTVEPLDRLDNDDDKKEEADKKTVVCPECGYEF